MEEPRLFTLPATWKQSAISRTLFPPSSNLYTFLLLKYFSDKLFKMKIPIETSGQVGIIATSTGSICLATSLVALRLVAKRISVGIDYSDYCILLGLVRPF